MLVGSRSTRLALYAWFIQEGLPCYILCDDDPPGTPRTLLTPRVTLSSLPRSPLATSLASFPDPTPSPLPFSRALTAARALRASRRAKAFTGHDGGAAASHARAEGQGPEKGQFGSLSGWGTESSPPPGRASPAPVERF